MKKIFYILILTFSVTTASFAQDDGPDDGAGKIREKMIEYVQQKLGLSKSEAEKFQPVFMDYLRQLKTTKHDFQGDRLVLQQKIAELRLRYRDQFRPIVGEKRSNEVFTHERDFIQKVVEERNDRLQNRKDGPPNKRFRSMLQ
jgi:hypothetical protein